jgi:acyl-CoA thioesterase FadM
MIPLFYDWLFGMVVTTADIRPTRTAYLHVDFRSITPIDQPLTAHGRITSVDGRKVFIDATMTAADGTLLSEANGLMVRLLPHQP